MAVAGISGRSTRQGEMLIIADATSSWVETGRMCTDWNSGGQKDSMSPSSAALTLASNSSPQPTGLPHAMLDYVEPVDRPGLFPTPQIKTLSPLPS